MTTTQHTSTPTRTVRIPARDDHDGRHSVQVTLEWVCPRCGAPRGEPERGISYDGSRRLAVDTCENPCGHTDYYSVIRERELVGSR